MLGAVYALAPNIYPFVYSAYSTLSDLIWGDRALLSAEGVQQGDPLGPLLFCLTVHQLCGQLLSELCVMGLGLELGQGMALLQHSQQLEMLSAGG